MKVLIGLIFTFSIIQCFAQDSTKVRFHVRGGQVYYVRIDGVLMPVTNIMKVSKGSHKIEIWSPKYKLYEGRLETGNLDSTNFVAILEYHKDWPKYIAEREYYKNQLFWNHTAPFFGGIVATTATPFTYFWRLNKHEEKVKEAFYAQYRSSNTLNATNTYNLSNGLFFSSLFLTILCDTTFFALQAKANRLQPPVFKQENPFTHEIVEIKE